MQASWWWGTRCRSGRTRNWRCSPGKSKRDPSTVRSDVDEVIIYHEQDPGYRWHGWLYQVTVMRDRARVSYFDRKTTRRMSTWTPSAEGSKVMLSLRCERCYRQVRISRLHSGSLSLRSSGLIPSLKGPSSEDLVPQVTLSIPLS